MVDWLIKKPMFICGIGCIIISLTGFCYKSAVVIIAALTGVVIALLIYRKANAKYVFTSILIFVMCLSCLLTLNKIKKLNYHTGSKFKAELTVCDISYKADEYYIATAQVMKSDRLPKGTKITVFYEPSELCIGQKITADIKVKAVDEKYKKSNYSEGIYLQANMSNILVSENYDFVLTTAEKVRNYIKSTLFGHLDYREASTLCALIFGEKGYFTDEFYSCVKAAGVSHVMVVSGMHMAILVSLFVKILEKLFYNRFAKAFTVIGIVLFLWVLCGFTMSVLRAGMTYAIMAIGIMLDRKGTPENTLSAAVSLILIASPFAIFSVSLQLSLLSTFGILVIALPVMDYLKRNKTIRSKLLNAVITSVVFSLSATVMTLPVTIYMFGCISTVSVISNLLISSAVTAALSVAVVGLIVNVIVPFMAKPVFKVSGLLAKYINYVIEYLGSLPFAVKQMPEYTAYIAIFIIFALFTLLLACKKRSNMLKLEAMNEKIIKEGGGKLKWR